jgi:DNA topoisomerase-1
VAQRLYEGIKVHGEHTALISYPRTDSTRYSPIFVEKAQQYIVKQYGQEYYDDRHAHDAKKASANNNVQDAHEAIRIIDLTLDPERIKDQIAADDYRLYRLI